MMLTYLFLFFIAQGYSSPDITHHRRGFEGLAKLEKLIVFGDSYSKISFKPAGNQPSPANPYGNNGSSSANGPNWVNFLTETYNQSAFLTYDLAIGGAVVDQNIVQSSTGAEFVSQLDDYINTYGDLNDFFEADTSLFVSWFGINDIINSYLGGDLSVNGDVITRYRELLADVYDIGARNFIIINIPPLERSPRITGSSASATRIPLAKAAVDDYNARLSKMARSIDHDLPYSRVFFYDAHSVINSVIDQPSKYPETDIYQNTQSFCSAYKSGTDEIDTKFDECDYPVNQYLWLDNIHPIQPILYTNSWPAISLSLSASERMAHISARWGIVIKINQSPLLF